MRILFASLMAATLLSACNNSKQQAEGDAFIDSLLAVMTTEEKLGQLTLYTSGWDMTGPTLNENYLQDIKAGRCGNLFNALTVAYNKELQRIAVEETRLKIPLLFGYDVIHGHRTIFPIPLAEAASWDLQTIEKSARYSAMEAAASGLNWTFNPMVDIARDPRWGRMAEGAGEDPYLGSLIGAAKVRGYQGTDLSDPLTIAACVKHFAAYGASQAGRDYHTVDMSLRTLYETYLPPYKAAIDAGAATVMSSFNELDGVPATGNAFLLTEVLRNQWGFEGLVVTDYTSITEMIPHGFAEDEKHAAELAINAGVDMDMQGGLFINYLKQSLEQGKVTEETINTAVRRVLELKKKLGLFEDPYRYLDEGREREILFSEEIMNHALEAARKSIVLLENNVVGNGKLLPVSQMRTIALIGPLADNKLDLLGTWHASGDGTKVVTVREGLAKKFPNAQIRYARGCDFKSGDRSGFAEAIAAAAGADVVIMAIGEDHTQSGEAASRADISLPGVQEYLVKAVLARNKNVVAVVMAGRPLTIPWLAENVPALVYAWHLGTRAGDAIADVLAGDYNPSGKLPVTMPRAVGQVPIYYSMKNTGRPFDENSKYTTKYLDISNEPLYPFGYGLSYGDFQYGELSLGANAVNEEEGLAVTVRVTNAGAIAGEEVVQLYIRDWVGSVTRPVKELKAFQKVSLAPGESRDIAFTITDDDLAFYRQDMTFGVEPGKFSVFVGGNSRDVKRADFELVGNGKGENKFEFKRVGVDR